MTGDDASLPVVEPDEFDPPVERPGDDESVSGILLAAGTSSRFGEENKLLATIDGTPLVRRAARTLLASAVDRVVVVVGHEADRVRGALDGLDLDIVVNEDYEQGQATSVRTGVRALSEGVDAAVFALGDMPAVAPESVDLLVEAHRAGVGDALAPAYEGNRGNPVLFDARFFEQLRDVSGDTGGRAILLESDAAALVETDDAGVVLDVDRPEALEQFE